MYQMLNVKRHRCGLELWSGPFQMKIIFICEGRRYEWELKGYPISLLQAAQIAIKNAEERLEDSQLPHQYSFDVKSQPLNGCFKSKSSPSWVDLAVETPIGLILVAMRLEEVKRLKLLLDEYWCD
jgi:hypothetical protein